jgi:predicted RNase H-like HicB family nuclease
MKPAKAWQAVLAGNANIGIGDAVKLAEAFGYKGADNRIAPYYEASKGARPAKPAGTTRRQGQRISAAAARVLCQSVWSDHEGGGMTMDYAIVLFRDPVDDDWIATVPDLGRGVSAFGDTPEEALHEIEIVIAAVLDAMREQGNAPPEPRYRPEHEMACA